MTLRSAWAAWLFVLWSIGVGAHDVPDRVQVTAQVKAESGHLSILVRLPANALIDFLLPALPDSNWLDLQNIGPVMDEAAKVWIADRLIFYENGVALPKPQLLAVRLSRNNDPAFGTHATALAHMSAAPIPRDALVLQEQVTVDAQLELPIGSATSEFSYTPQFGRLGVLVFTTLAYWPENAAELKFVYEGDPPTFHLNPSLATTWSNFIFSGSAFVVCDRELLLGLLCVALLLLRTARAKPFLLALLATQWVAMMLFEILMLSSLSISWFAVVAQVLGAAAAVYLGIEVIVANAIGAPGPAEIGADYTVPVVAGGILGCVVAAALHNKIQFGGAYPVSAALSYLIGVVLLECSLLAIAVLMLKVLLRLSSAPTAVAIIIAALAIHVSWWEMLDRAKSLTLYALPEQLLALKGWGVVSIAVVVFAMLLLSRRSTSKPHSSEPIG